MKAICLSFWQGIYYILSHLGGCGGLFERCIFMRASMSWLAAYFKNFISYSLDVMRIYNLDTPSSRKSLVLRSEPFSCAVKVGHFDKSLHMMNKVLPDISKSLPSPSPGDLWFQQSPLPQAGKWNVV